MLSWSSLEDPSKIHSLISQPGHTPSWSTTPALTLLISHSKCFSLRHRTAWKVRRLFSTISFHHDHVSDHHHHCSAPANCSTRNLQLRARPRHQFWVGMSLVSSAVFCRNWAWMTAAFKWYLRPSVAQLEDSLGRDGARMSLPPFHLSPVSLS